MATISDVAKRAGVAPVTVSRVINNAENVSPATRARVQQAIDALGYVPSGVAQSLRSKRTRSLALVVPDITNAFWTTVARGVEDAAQSHGYSVFLCNTDEDLAKQLRYLDVVISQRVDGVLIAPYDSDKANLGKLPARNIPTVIIDRHIEGWNVDTVTGDSISGARALTQHLIGLGHSRIAMITGAAETSTAADRVAGYQFALAEAGLPFDPHLIKYGEFRADSGERLTHEVLNEEPPPTAIFAANNAIAMGVVDALEQRGLRTPQDIALVVFDDLPNTSHFFPFFTVAVQPAYEIGVNAAQLLLSRLEAEVSLQPRHVVLPTRLIIRHSCGSRMTENGGCTLSLPLSKETEMPSQLIRRLTPAEMRQASARLEGVTLPATRRELGLSTSDKSDLNRLLKVLRHQEADRVPYLEFWVTSQAVFEYVLEHRLEYEIVDAKVGGQSIKPEDHVEFARRLGMDAVTCNFSWRPNNVFGRASNGTEHYVDGSLKSPANLDDLEPPPPLANQLNYLERYLRAAQGTGVGVLANFTSFFDSAMLAVGMMDSLYLFYDNRPFLENVMDILLEHQARVVRAVCDRFADDLAFILINDDIAHNAGPLIHPDMFAEIFADRMKRLIAPAKEHDKLVAIHTDGKVEGLLPLLSDIGFNIVHPLQPEANDIFAIRERWAGKMALVGNIPTSLLAYGCPEEIEATVQEYCARLAPGGGYVLGSSTSIEAGIPPENFVAMIQAVHRYGRYDSLGQEF